MSPWWRRSSAIRGGGSWRRGMPHRWRRPAGERAGGLGARVGRGMRIVGGEWRGRALVAPGCGRRYVRQGSRGHLRGAGGDARGTPAGEGCARRPTARRPASLQARWPASGPAGGPAVGPSGRAAGAACPAACTSGIAASTAKMASRTLSDVGRVPRPPGATSARPRHSPPTILMPRRLSRQDHRHAHRRVFANGEGIPQ